MRWTGKNNTNKIFARKLTAYMDNTLEYGAVNFKIKKTLI